ncbi:uncharacterized protein LOC141631432 [Silene latifolia]|uniref:uncharacterized protein LOC141631432 n=1 Tax=Silene latifolia TaxID=37657 RepID=UPI003D772FB9
MATFSAASGLKVNAAKSEVVFNGVAVTLKADIIQVSGFQEGTLPFKYLGIPIQPGRLLRRDCQVLIDKIVRKIRGIGARKLSYAGRLVLINSVLNTLHNYWASIFLIPKCVIHQIEAICRNFLWDNSSEYHRAPLVAWTDICHTKKEGGLGIKNVEVWNVASVGKLVHWLYTKADSLWVLWIDHVYLKGADWSNYHPPPDSNWNWRNICKTRELLSGGYQGHHWNGQPTGTGYTVSSGYCWLQGTHPPVQWYSDVWSLWNIPKYAFIGWLVQRKALNTRVKLARLSLCSSDRCFLCEADAETHEHLFTDCIYTSKVTAGVEDWMHLTLTGGTGYTKLQWKICSLAKMAIWYNIWYIRNTCRLDHKVKKPEHVVAEIIAQVSQRIIQKVDSIEKLQNRDCFVASIAVDRVLPYSLCFDASIVPWVVMGHVLHWLLQRLSVIVEGLSSAVIKLQATVEDLSTRVVNMENQIGIMKPSPSSRTLRTGQSFNTTHSSKKTNEDKGVNLLETHPESWDELLEKSLT